MSLVNTYPYSEMSAEFKRNATIKRFYKGDVLTDPVVISHMSDDSGIKPSYYNFIYPVEEQIKIMRNFDFIVVGSQVVIG